MSVRLKLTLSYAGFLMLAGLLLLAAVRLFLLRDVPLGRFVPEPSDFLRVFTPGNFGPIIFGPAAILVLAFLLVFGLVGGWFLAGRMLAPLDRITEATRIAATGSLAHRIHLPGRDDEFRELADAFDAMLARLDAHVAEQRRFAANASHELRTPLAVSRTLLDVARADPDRDTDRLIERLQAVNSRAIDLTEALLQLSRADQRSFTPEPVDLSLLAEEAVETLLPLADARGVTISVDVDVDVARTSGSPALLLQLTTNLVHNAIVHNVHPGTVWVTTAAGPRTVVLTVENTGEELAPDLVPTLVEPFRRGTDRIRGDSRADRVRVDGAAAPVRTGLGADRVHSGHDRADLSADRTRTDHDGVGLGLAIARSVVRAHDGTITLAARPGGGLRVVVELAVAAPSAG